MGRCWSYFWLINIFPHKSDWKPQCGGIAPALILRRSCIYRRTCAACLSVHISGAVHTAVIVQLLLQELSIAL